MMSHFLCTLCRQLRQEFTYWYPVDVHACGRDQIKDHLTHFLYNHQAIWPTPERGEVEGEEICRWPNGIRANGHLLLNSEKVRFQSPIMEHSCSIFYPAT